tara:strand:+ start:286 stop:459 length:174 start_codon:yes stop_codon:yes gene_type:complete
LFLYGKPFSTFCSPFVNNKPASFGGHARPEAVRSLSLQVTWLVGSFHNYLKLYLKTT